MGPLGLPQAEHAGLAQVASGNSAALLAGGVAAVSAAAPSEAGMHRRGL